MEKSKITKSLAVFASVLLIIIIGVASFAYFGTFNVNLNNNVAVNINAVSPGDATFTSNASQLNLQVPAANMSQTAADNETPAATNTATLTVNLTGAANLLTTCTYDIVYEYDANSNVYGVSPTTKNGDKEITLQVSGVNGTNNFASEKNFDSNTISSYKNGNVYTLVSGATISSNGTLTTQNISITGKYYNLTIPQTSIEGKAFTGKIYVTNHNCSTSEIPPAYITLLNAYGGKDSITELPDSTFANVTTASEKGLYKADDDYTATTGMKSYYFRGAVDNNWVKFGKDSTGKDIYWRIIRINGDGSIRMIYTGTTAPTSSTATVMTGTGTQINATTYQFYSSSDNPSYVGYMFTEGQQHGNDTSSTIKTVIDNWYKTTTLETDATTKRLVADQIFCNDRSATTNYSGTPGEISGSMSTSELYTYGAYVRLMTNKSPKLTCPTASDKFTVNGSNGNGALTYPVGLITADEVAMAGGNWNLDNSTYYLYTNQTYWSGSPTYFDSLHSGATELYVDSSGYFTAYGVNFDSGARPVISLSSKAKFSGSGTYNDVYTVN